MSDELVKVTEENFDEVVARFKDGGAFFTAGHYPIASFKDDASFTIIGDADPRNEEVMGYQFNTTHGSDFNRGHSLKPRRDQTPNPRSRYAAETTAALASFQRLEVGGYDFEIEGGEWGLGGGFFNNESVVYVPYVPEGKLLEEAFRQGINLMVGKIDARLEEKWGHTSGLTGQHVEPMVEYAMRDFDTGRIFQANRQAGLAADAAHGYGV
jgi:hypothetical protein